MAMGVLFHLVGQESRLREGSAGFNDGSQGCHGTISAQGAESGCRQNCVSGFRDQVWGGGIITPTNVPLVRARTCGLTYSGVLGFVIWLCALGEVEEPVVLVSTNVLGCGVSYFRKVGLVGTQWMER